MGLRRAAIVVPAILVFPACLNCQAPVSFDTDVDDSVLQSLGITSPVSAEECEAVCAWSAGVDEFETVESCSLTMPSASDDTASDVAGHLTCEAMVWAGCK